MIYAIIAIILLSAAIIVLAVAAHTATAKEEEAENMAWQEDEVAMDQIYQATRPGALEGDTARPRAGSSWIVP